MKITTPEQFAAFEEDLNEAFDRWGYLGLTVLRMSDVSDGLPRTRYAQFIDKYRN